MSNGLRVFVTEYDAIAMRLRKGSVGFCSVFLGIYQ